jgi:hypothetical protein
LRADLGENHLRVPERMSDLRRVDALWLLRLALPALLALSLVSPVAAAQLKGLQSGTATVAGGATLTVTLPTAVDTTKAFLVFGTAESTGDPLDGHVSGQLTGAGTTITFQQAGGAASVDIKYYVVEFSSGVSVQRGSIDIATGDVFDVALAAVDTTKSFPLISFRSAGANFNCNDFVRAKLTSGTNLQLSSNVATCGTVATSVVEWQVVEYQDASVQTGDVTFAATDLSAGATLAPAVNTAKSWLIYSYEATADVTPDIGQYLVRGLLSGPTTLAFDRNNAGGTGLSLTWYLVEFTDASTVQSGSQPFLAADTAENVTLATAAPRGTSIALGGGDYQRGGRSPYSANDVAGVSWFNFDLTTSTNLRITRGAGGLAAADVGWFVVTFATAPTAVKLESFTAAAGDASVRLEWQTGSELDNLGFNLYRALDEDGPWRRLTASLIPGLGSSPLGKAYAYLDAGLTNGTRYYYRLEDVDASSKATSHGPVSAVPVAGAASSTGEPASAPSRAASSTSCPAWVMSAYGSLTDGVSSSSPSVCTRHGDPEAVSLAVVTRDALSAVLELRTGGFYALHEPAGGVRVFVPGFDFPERPRAEALPFKRALVEAVVGRRVQLGEVRELEPAAFPGLIPAALGEPEMRLLTDGTVRAARRWASRTATRPPAEAATLLPSVFQGDLKSAVVAMSPLRYDARRRELLLCKRLRVRLRFTGREPWESGHGSRGRRWKRPAKPTGQVLARLHTTAKGLYAASFEALFPGRTQSLPLNELSLERQGLPVPFHVEPGGPDFGPGGRLFFFADVAVDSSAFSAETAFELVRASGGVEMPLASARPSSAPEPSGPMGRAEFEVNYFYEPALLDAPDLWLWDAAVTGATRAEPFELAGVDTTSAASGELEVALQGGSESGQPVDHHVRVAVNGVPLGEAQFAGKVPFRMSLGLPPGILRAGANELELTNVGDTGVTSVVFLDRFELAYPATSVLTGGTFSGEWSEPGAATVEGAPGGSRLLDVTSADGGGGAAVWLTGQLPTPGGLQFQAEAGHRYLAVADASVVAPRVESAGASSLRTTANQADYILIAPRAFLESAEPLLARRRDQGLRARAVAFEEIADEFGHGQPSAEAIKAFLAYAYQSWARPSPRYVLLLGDATYDPRNFTGTAQPSPLPALWTKTSYLWTVSDPLLAAVNGEDALPDLAVGRLPATTVEDAQRLVGKLLAWEESGQGLSGEAVLVADDPDGGDDFEANAEDIAGSFLPGRSRLLKVRELGASTRSEIAAALDSGLGYLDYVGHGGVAVWASENVWNSWDVDSLLAQSRQPFLLTFNCLNGYFVAPTYDSLAESLVKAGGRGAIAAFSPSGLSLDAPAHQLHRALMQELVSGRHARLGDAILAAQQAYAQSGLMPELLSVYHLFGDPATTLR